MDLLDFSFWDPVIFAVEFSHCAFLGLVYFYFFCTSLISGVCCLSGWDPLFTLSQFRISQSVQSVIQQSGSVRSVRSQEI